MTRAATLAIALAPACFTTGSGSPGEYNGKFMPNQFVLRGGCCAAPRAQIRPAYRNFFYAPHHWRFTGIRLARSL